MNKTMAAMFGGALLGMILTLAVLAIINGSLAFATASHVEFFLQRDQAFELRIEQLEQRIQQLETE